MQDEVQGDFGVHSTRSTTLARIEITTVVVAGENTRIFVTRIPIGVATLLTAVHALKEKICRLISVV